MQAPPHKDGSLWVVALGYGGGLLCTKLAVVKKEQINGLLEVHLEIQKNSLALEIQFYFLEMQKEIQKNLLPLETQLFFLEPAKETQLFFSDPPIKIL